jgi:hypothetical protein
MKKTSVGQVLTLAESLDLVLVSKTQMGTGFDFWNWIQNWKLDFCFATESSMMVSNQPHSWLHLCLEPRFVKRKKEKKVGGLLEVFLVPFMHGTRTFLIYYLRPNWRLFIKVKNCPITLEKTVLGNYPVWLVRPVESCSDL